MIQGRLRVFTLIHPHKIEFMSQKICILRKNFSVHFNSIPKFVLGQITVVFYAFEVILRPTLKKNLWDWLSSWIK